MILPGSEENGAHVSQRVSCAQSIAVLPFANMSDDRGRLPFGRCFPATGPTQTAALKRTWQNQGQGKKAAGSRGCRLPLFGRPVSPLRRQSLHFPLHGFIRRGVDLVTYFYIPRFTPI